MAKTAAFNVYLDGRLIDTVWFTGYTAEEARRSLIDHDRYDPRITVREGAIVDTTGREARAAFGRTLERALDLQRTQTGRQAWADITVDAFRRVIGVGEDRRLANHDQAVAHLIRGLVLYADAHSGRFLWPLGDDYVLGPHWRAIAEGLRGLLNGELGALDAGTCDSILSDVAKAVGLPLEE